MQQNTQASKKCQHIKNLVEGRQRKMCKLMVGMHCWEEKGKWAESGSITNELQGEVNKRLEKFRIDSINLLI